MGDHFAEALIKIFRFVDGETPEKKGFFIGFHEKVDYVILTSHFAPAFDGAQKIDELPVLFIELADLAVLGIIAWHYTFPLSICTNFQQDGDKGDYFIATSVPSAFERRFRNGVALL
jgi:hypothetical protein